MIDYRTSVLAILAAGQSAGYWVRYEPQHADSASFRVFDSDGRNFLISAGGYRDEGKARAILGYYHDRESCLSESASGVEARVSIERDPAIAARELFKRCTGSPEGIANSDAARAKLAEKLSQRAALRANIERAAALGYHVAQTKPGDPVPPIYKYWDVTMYAAGKPGIELHANGSIRLLHAPYTTIDALPAIIAVLKESR